MKKVAIPIVFTLGMVAGATIATLYAPHSGKITRNKLKNKYDEKLELLNEKVADFQQAAKSLKNKVS
jgi:gas vesicle protein